MSPALRPRRWAVGGAVLAGFLLAGCVDHARRERISLPLAAGSPLRGALDLAGVRASLSDYAVVEERSLSNFTRLFVAGGPRTRVDFQSRTQRLGLIRAPYSAVDVRFADRRHRVSDRHTSNGELEVDGLIYVGWVFVLTEDRGLEVLDGDPTFKELLELLPVAPVPVEQGE